LRAIAFHSIPLFTYRYESLPYITTKLTYPEIGYLEVSVIQMSRRWVRDARTARA